MNRLNRSILTAALAGGVGLGVLGFAQAGSTDRPATPIRMDDYHGAHPHMHDALEHLRAARKELDAADPIFAHHRDDAIEQTDKAIKLAEDAWHEAGEKAAMGVPAASPLDDVKHPHMHKALEELHEAYKELDDCEPAFSTDKRDEAVEHVKKAIDAIHDGLKNVEK